MALHKLVFDATDADTRAASANVGAYLRASDGTLLTHTDVGGKKALDVRVAEGINVEVDLSHVDDSVKIGDGADFLEINADGSINITDNGGSITVDGTVTANQGTSPWVIGDGGGSITVDASDLDIRDLVYTQDSVTAYQGTSPWVISGAVTTTSDPALADSALKAVAETVGVAAAQIVDGADELASRKYLYLYNNGNRTAYIGESGVTVSSGFPLPPGSILEARIGAAVDVYMIADAAAQNIRTLQLS